MIINESIAKRLFAFVDLNGKQMPHMDTRCFGWKGSFKRGYGQLKINNKTPTAHRLMWEFTNGEIPDNLYVLHHCDNRECCRPDHLFLGTQKDNMQDMAKKGRANYPKGSNSSNFKLLEEQVLEIRRLHATGNYTQIELGRQFKVKRSTVYNIIHNITWKHLL